MEPKFNNMGRLVPAGKVALHSCEVLDNTHVIGVRATLIDEAGVLWDGSHLTFRSEAKCLRWPTNVDAIYRFERPKSDYSSDRHWECRANSRDEAWVRLKEDNSWMHRDREMSKLVEVYRTRKWEEK